MPTNYLGARTAFGVIIALEPWLYNPTAVVEAPDGSTSEHKLPKLIALGLTMKEEHHVDHSNNR